MPKQKTNEEFLKDLKKINNRVIPLEDYIKSNIKIKFKCLECNNIFEMIPSSILGGYSCPACGIKSRARKKSKTHEKFICEIENINPNINILGKYINSKEKIKCECKIDGNIWYAIPGSLLKGSGCPVCGFKNTASKKVKNNEQFNQDLKNKNPNIIALEKYINAHTKIKFKCNICDNIWEAKPHDILQGKGCRQCAINAARERRLKTHEQFIENLKKINPNIEIIDKYTNSKSKIKYRCLICGNISETKASHLINGVGCNVCCAPHMERKVQIFLYNHNIQYIHQKTFKKLVGINNGLLSYDFYLPQYNLLIECQGRQHINPIDYFGGEKDFKIQKEHDKRKAEYAKRNNIKLLEIWYYDEKKIEKILTKELNIK